MLGSCTWLVPPALWIYLALVPAAVSLQWLLYGGQESWGGLPGLWDLEKHMDTLFFCSEAIQFLFRSDSEIEGGYLWSSPVLTIGDITHTWHYCKRTGLNLPYSACFGGRLISNENVVIQNMILNVAPGFICKNYYGAIVFFTLKLHIGFDLLQIRGQERGLTIWIEY